MSLGAWLSRLSAWSWILALALWMVACVAWADRLVRQIFDPYRHLFYDWHVYAAGSRDFVAGNLYTVELVSPYPIPVNAYNMPPGSALITIPFLVFPDAIGGMLWLVLNIVATAVAAVLTAHIAGLRPVWLWSGAAFCAYSLIAWAAVPALLGNNTPVVLLILVGFVATHLSGRQVLGGALLGVAIATKLWPASYLVILARERSWPTMGWAIGTAAVIVGGSLLWLGGPSAIGPMITALGVNVDPNPGQAVLGFTWLAVYTDWWPAWGGYAAAVVMLLIPATGLTGYGLATLAGLAAIPNLWKHYLGTSIFGIVLLVRGLVDWRTSRARSGGDPESAGALGTVSETAADRL